MKNIFVTGANGFVGSHLCTELINKKFKVLRGVRVSSQDNDFCYGDIASFDDWEKRLSGIDVIIHLAARVHVMSEFSENPLELFRQINVNATLKLATVAKKMGIKRFIFISSIKVNGEKTRNPFTAQDNPSPEDAYGISKMEAEACLLKLHEEGVFEVVIIRPPLIYGPGVKANFEKLFKLVSKGMPFPFGSVDNKRSLVSVFNLIDVIIICITHKKAQGEVFLVSDGNDLSLKDLIKEMGYVLKKETYFFNVPVGVMSAAAGWIGKESLASRIFGNLQVDIEKTKKYLDWNPQFNFQKTFNKN